MDGRKRSQQARRGLVDIHRRYDVERWCGQFCIDERRLREWVTAVGRSAGRVRIALGR